MDVTEALAAMTELMRGVAIDAGLGIAIGLLALALPFRRLQGHTQVGADLLAWMLVVLFALLVESLLDVPAGLVTARLSGWHESIDAAPWWLVVPAYVVLADFGAYWAHRALHTRWLWPTHAWHHSPKYLYWLAGLRGSPIHLLVLFAPYYLAFIVLPVHDAALASSILLVLDVSNQHYIHSNLKLPYAQHLERIFVTPRFHFVHHSAIARFANSNYGFVFSVWDRLFGTFTDPATIPPDDALGLGYEVSGWRLALGLPPRKSRPAGARGELSRAKA
jgi:sterol desaturase/sphingolipid hydroxylase (fatty acid hydroxylase superfamily)